jgi:uncharacterized protein YjeT (DUF2065 family)
MLVQSFVKRVLRSAKSMLNMNRELVDNALRLAGIVLNNVDR